MATQGTRDEINKLIARIPDEVLIDLLNYLKAVANTSDKVELSQNLSKILREDRNLLDRLAK